MTLGHLVRTVVGLVSSTVPPHPSVEVFVKEDGIEDLQPVYHVELVDGKVIIKIPVSR